MISVELQEELHANTRRTRITYRALVGGELAAIKCYRKPVFGLIHCLRALHRGKKIRRVGGPVPPIIFVGWVESETCFGYGMAFLEGYRPLRYLLLEEPNRQRQVSIVRLLGETMADLHKRGIEQPDGNLTNFLMGETGTISMVDEDDIRVHSQALSPELAVSNLANVAARLPDKVMIEALLGAYLEAGYKGNHPEWDEDAFWGDVEACRSTLELKRMNRNIAPRRFD